MGTKYFMYSFLKYFRPRKFNTTMEHSKLKMTSDFSANLIKFLGVLINHILRNLSKI